MALLIIGLLAIGLYMSDLPASAAKFKLYDLHKATGILVLMLAVARLGWRFSNSSPSLEHIAVWEARIATTLQWVFYALMIAMPLTGWFMSSASNHPVHFFGLAVLPDLIATNKNAADFFHTLHVIIGYSLIVLIVLHTSAALKHHFINKDDILKRML